MSAGLLVTADMIQLLIHDPLISTAKGRRGHQGLTGGARQSSSVCAILTYTSVHEPCEQAVWPAASKALEPIEGILAVPPYTIWWSLCDDLPFWEGDGLRIHLQEGPYDSLAI